MSKLSPSLRELAIQVGFDRLDLSRRRAIEIHTL
jgi:hypothetical protein